jgi:hypothetical protein
VNIASEILAKTPVWIYPLLSGLIVLGLIQTKDRSMGWLRTVLIPFGFLIFSLYGVLSSFGLHAATTLLWLGGVLAGAAVGMALGVTAQPSSTARQVVVKGSWVPMAMIMGIFLTKYSVGVATALQVPALQTAQSAYLISLLYGVFSGVFVGRAVLVLRMIQRKHGMRA